MVDDKHKYQDDNGNAHDDTQLPNTDISGQKGGTASPYTGEDTNVDEMTPEDTLGEDISSDNLEDDKSEE